MVRNVGYRAAMENRQRYEHSDIENEETVVSSQSVIGEKISGAGTAIDNWQRLANSGIESDATFVSSQSVIGEINLCLLSVTVRLEPASIPVMRRQANRIMALDLGKRIRGPRTCPSEVKPHRRIRLPDHGTIHKSVNAKGMLSG